MYIVSDAIFGTAGVLSVTLHIVDLVKYRICCIRSSVTRCTLVTVIYLNRMCQYGLHAVLWSHIILMLLFVAKPRSTAILLCPSVALYNDLADIVFDGVGLQGFKSWANAFLLA